MLEKGVNYVLCHLKDVDVPDTNVTEVEVLVEFPHTFPPWLAHSWAVLIDDRYVEVMSTTLVKY